MSTAATAIVVGGFLAALLLLLVFVPKAVAEAVTNVKRVKVGRVLALEFFERAVIQRGGGNPDSAQLEASIEKIKSGRILWVDDVPTNNLLETQALRMLGVQIDAVTTNKEAAEYLKASAKSPYDLVLSDIGRESEAENGDVGLAMPDVIKGSGSTAPLAFYVGRKTGDTTSAGNQVFNTPQELLPYVVTELGRSKATAGS